MLILLNTMWNVQHSLSINQHKKYSSNKIVNLQALTHWGRVTHIGISKLTIIGSDNERRQASIWINAVILLIGTLVTNFSETLSKIHIFSFKKMYLNTSSAKRRPFCLGRNVLTMKCECFTCLLLYIKTAICIIEIHQWIFFLWYFSATHEFQ